MWNYIIINYTWLYEIYGKVRMQSDTIIKLGNVLDNLSRKKITLAFKRFKDMILCKYLISL
jgi:hypothetical protein